MLTRMHPGRVFPCLWLILTLPVVASTGTDEARMNQIQVVGSHNSYKQAIDPSLWRLFDKERPGRLDGVEYAHAPLTEQLNLGLRNLELDVLHDPEGGRYANPQGVKLVADAGLPPGPPYDPDGLMKEPGLKVLHIQDIDFRTSVYTLEQALTELRNWSDAHPQHLPVAITMNAKDSPLELEGATPPLPFDKAAFDAWDAEIRKVLPAKKVITPDEVRGSHPTLEAAVLAHGWPTIRDARGRFLFVLDEVGDKMERYIDGHPSLRGRMMFVNAKEGRPEAAFRIVNEPKESFHYIQQLVRSGYLVRTRADADTKEARAGDYSRMRAAFASGAHFVTTDYYRQNPDFESGYRVRLPGGGPGRWNPLLLPTVRPLPRLE